VCAARALRRDLLVAWLATSALVRKAGAEYYIRSECADSRACERTSLAVCEGWSKAKEVEDSTS